MGSVELVVAVGLVGIVAVADVLGCFGGFLRVVVVVVVVGGCRGGVLSGSIILSLKYVLCSTIIASMLMHVLLKQHLVPSSTLGGRQLPSNISQMLLFSTSLQHTPFISFVGSMQMAFTIYANIAIVSRLISFVFIFGS